MRKNKASLEQVAGLLSDLAKNGQLPTGPLTEEELSSLLPWIRQCIKGRSLQNGHRFQDAEDVAQECALHVLWRIRQIQVGLRDPKTGPTGRNGAKVRTWAYRVACYKSIDEVRRLNKYAERHMPIDEDDNGNIIG